eukprot:GHVN01106197.1.p1 GENE.GHVN01106197.1~~GHVN01106197.1.p1  ORF type:complete len:227 (+),score=42.14 GHVN01106197.1:78-758(+)
MKLFGRLTGRKKEEAKEPAEANFYAAIMKSREAMETLEKRRLHLEKKVDAQNEEIKAKATARDNNGALTALKRRKAYEHELTNVSNAKFTLERQILNLESAQSTSVAVGALQSGVQAQQQFNQQNDLNKIDKLMDEMQEQQDLQNDLNQVWAQGNAIGVGDDELLKELDALQGQMLDEKLLQTSVPNGSIGNPAGVVQNQFSAQQRAAAVSKSDEEQLRLLEAELG